MFGLFNRGKRSELKPIDWHPKLDEALLYWNNGEWSKLSDLLANLSNNSQFSLLQSLGNNSELDVIVGKFPDTPFAYTILGAVQVMWAWRHRGFGRGNEVDDERWEPFFNNLVKAYNNLLQSIELQPENSVAYSYFIRAATGLGDDYSVEIEPSARKLLQLKDPPMEGLCFAMQALSPKWHGDLETMYGYVAAVERQKEIHPSRLSLIARAQIENWLWEVFREEDEEKDLKTDFYFTQSQVVEKIVQANQKFNDEMIANKSSQKDEAAIWFAHNNLGCALYRAGQYKLAAAHIDALQDHPGEWPWVYNMGSPVAPSWPDLRKQVGLSKYITP